MSEYSLLIYKLNECLEVLLEDGCRISEERKDELNDEISNIIDKIN